MSSGVCRSVEEGLKPGAFFGLGGAHRNVLKIKPPLIINQAEANEVLDILSRAMTHVLRESSPSVRVAA